MAQISESIVKSFLSSNLNALIIEDIWKSPYRFDSGCVENHNGETIAARTSIGVRGATICFDLDVLFDQLKQLSVEEATIRIAALAFHEHIHHFQSVNDSMEKNEDAAYKIAAYVRTTAKFAQVPLLQWEGASAFTSRYQVVNKCKRDSKVLSFGRVFYRFDVNTSVLPTAVGAKLVQGLSSSYGVSIVDTGDSKILTLTGWVDFGFNLFQSVDTVERQAEALFKVMNEQYPNSLSISCNPPK